MNAGPEQFDSMRETQIRINSDCNESISLNSIVPPNDWSGFRINPQVNQFNPAFLPQMELGCPCQPMPNQFMFRQPNAMQFDQFMFMQPNAMRSDQFNYWDGYWKNYWQSYFNQQGRAQPQPGFERVQPGYEQEQPRFEREPDYDRQQRSRRREDFPPRREREREREPESEDNNDRRRERRSESNRFRSPENNRPNDTSDRTGTIVNSAREAVGQQLFKFIPGTPGRLGCAASVSAALSKAGFNYAKHAGVGGLSQILMKNGWTKHEGLQDARPGDVVVVARNAAWANGGGSAHIGIVGENGKVYHNSSGRQQWVEDSLQKVFGGGMMRFILRPPKA